MSNNLQRIAPERVLPAKLDAAVVAELDNLFEQYEGAATRTDLSPGARTMVSAIALLEVRQALLKSAMLRILRALEGSPIGFRTDKRRYSDATLVDACTEAILRGLPLLGNHFNILVERFYCTKEGFGYLVSKLAKFSMSFEVDKISTSHREAGGHVKVKVSGIYARRTLNGETADKEKLTTTYNVRMTKKNPVAEENAEGKARRKWLRDVYAILTGIELGEADPPTGASSAIQEVADLSLLEPSDLIPAEGTLPEGTWGDLEFQVTAAGLEDSVAGEYGPPGPSWELNRTAIEAAIESAEG